MESSAGLSAGGSGTVSSAGGVGAEESTVSPVFAAAGCSGISGMVRSGVSADAAGVSAVGLRVSVSGFSGDGTFDNSDADDESAGAGDTGVS